MPETISFSRMSYFASCPRKYYLKYEAKIPQPDNLPLITGKSIHKGNAEGYKIIIERNVPTKSQVVEIAVQEFETQVSQAIGSSGLEDVDGVPQEKDLMALAQGKYCDELMFKRSPKEVELRFDMNFKKGDLSVIGYLDRIDTEGDKLVVSEVKTSAQRKNLASFAPQTILYARAKHIHKGRVELIVKKKVPEIICADFDISPDDGVNMMANIRSIADAIARLKGQAQPFWWQNLGFACGMCWYRNLCMKKINQEGKNEKVEKVAV